jgi:Fe-S-cluster containining protein
MYWGETSAHPNGTVPEHLTEPINPHYVAMRGTHTTQGEAKRCIALRGNVGKQTSCEIYAHRSSTCASVHEGDSQCAKARAAHQLAPIFNP